MYYSKSFGAFKVIILSTDRFHVLVSFRCCDASPAEGWHDARRGVRNSQHNTVKFSKTIKKTLSRSLSLFFSLCVCLSPSLHCTLPMHTSSDSIG